MYFILHCIDKPNSLAIRNETRAAHLDYFGAQAAKVKLAGPLLDDDHATPKGSLLIVETKDRAEAERLAAGDPYDQAGLFESVTITPWKWVIGRPGA